jgi:peptidoglycan/xylan/chitin deacetylase (PgdA/CDA1 family)
VHNHSPRSGSSRRLLLRLLVLAGFLAPLVTPGNVGAATGMVVATNAVNIRACPSTACDILDIVHLGETLDITGEVINGFYPIAWQGGDGFVYALFVSAGGAAPWFREGDPSCNRVAIIFNIGIGYTPSSTIVQTLLDYNVAATMFPMGWWALEQPGFLRMLADSGFVIGTHGHGSVNLPTLTDVAIDDDVSTSIEAIEWVLGKPIAPYFTPYAADSDERVRAIVSGLGLLPVGWHVAAVDYGPDATEQSVYDEVMPNIYPGAIIELHMDGPATEQSTALALPRIIEDLWAQGYELVTIPDLVNPC